MSLSSSIIIILLLFLAVDNKHTSIRSIQYTILELETIIIIFLCKNKRKLTTIITTIAIC